MKTEQSMSVNDQKSDKSKEENELRPKSPIRRNHNIHQEREFRFSRIIRSQRSMRGIRLF